jgi:hypothetical protein
LIDLKRVLSVYDVSEIIGGLSKDAARAFMDLKDDPALYITMTFSVHNAEEYTSKFMVLKFPGVVERNASLGGLRSLVSEVQLKMSAVTPSASTNHTPQMKEPLTPLSVDSPGDRNATDLRASYEMLIVQLFILSNDLNEREEELIEMRKREEILQQHLSSKEKMYEQDAIVRMQLGKRLEQVLMDKEELKDQLDQLRKQLEHISNLTSGKVPITPVK